MSDDQIDEDTPGTYSVIYEAYDEGGLDYQYDGSGSCNAAEELVFVFVVEDTTDPNIAFGCNSEVTLECGEETDIPDPEASCDNEPCSDFPTTESHYQLGDSCDDNDAWTENGITCATISGDECVDLAGDAQGACPVTCGTCPTGDFETVYLDATGEHSIEYTCHDGYNEASIAQSVQVVDTTPPVITCPADEEFMYGDTFEEWYSFEATADDGCDDAVTLTHDAFDTVDTSTLGTYEVTFTATDADGLTDTCVQEVMVVDLTDPVCNFDADCSVGQYSDVEQCTGEYTEYDIPCTDDYYPDFAMSITSIKDENNNEYDAINVWIAGDWTIEYEGCDDSDNCAGALTRTVTIEDTTPPVMTVGGPDYFELEASDDDESAAVGMVDIQCTDTCTAFTIAVDSKTDGAVKDGAESPSAGDDMQSYIHVGVESLSWGDFESSGLDSTFDRTIFADNQEYYCEYSGTDDDVAGNDAGMSATAALIDFGDEGAMSDEIESELYRLSATCGVYQVSYTCYDMVGLSAEAVQYIVTSDNIDPDIQTYLASAGVVAGSASVFLGAVGLVAVATVMAAQRSRRTGYDAMSPV
jgi:hypothetical protein